MFVIYLINMIFISRNKNVKYPVNYRVINNMISINIYFEV